MTFCCKLPLQAQLPCILHDSILYPLLTAKPMLGRSLFLLQNRFLPFWPSYCQISTNLDKILHTPIVVRNTLLVRLTPRSARGRLQAKPERLCFSVIIVTHLRARCTNAQLTIWLANRELTLTTAQLTRCRVARSTVN